MAQFDVYKNPNPKTRRQVPYLLDVQSDLLDPIATRVVVPLIRTSKSNQAITRLNPVFDIDNTRVMLSTAELAGVAQNALGKHVTSLKEQRTDIINALDVLFTGI